MTGPSPRYGEPPSDTPPTTDAHHRPSLATIMGGTKLNLRRATMAPNGARLDITTLMGDTEVRVPEDWAVQVNASPILGGVKDETRDRTYQPGEPVLTIRATSIMSDIKIRRVD